jgi:hypothetical protein
MAFSFGRGIVYSDKKGRDTRSSNYIGILRVSGDYRLITSANGARYILQHHPFPTADWNVKAWALSLSILVGRFPAGLVFEDLGSLPELPIDLPPEWRPAVVR